jgi:hypothetical protein
LSDPTQSTRFAATLQQSQQRGMPRKIQFMSTKKANLPAIE